MAHTSAPYMRSKSSPNRFMRFNFFETLSPPADYVSRQAMDTAIAGIRADVVNGVYTEFGVDEPTIMVDSDGRWCRSVGAYLCHYYPSGAPVTKSQTLAAGTYTMWCEGTGSATFNGHTATEDSPTTFVLAAGTTATLTVTGTLTKLQINDGLYALPYLTTIDSVRLSADESGSETNGNSYTSIGQLLDGVADGVEDAPDITICSLTNYDDGLLGADGLTIERNTELNIIATPDNDGGWVRHNIVCEVGDRFEITSTFADYGLAEPKVGYYQSDWSGSITSSFQGNRCVLRTVAATGELMYIVCLRTSADIPVTLTSLSIKKISPAQGRLTIPIKLGFNAGDVSGDMNLITANDETGSFLVYDATNEQFKFTDGTNTATAPHTAVVYEPVGVVLEYGIYDGNPKMRIITYDIIDGAWVNGVTGDMVDFSGVIPNDEKLTKGWGDELIYLGPIEIEKVPTWVV